MPINSKGFQFIFISFNNFPQSKKQLNYNYYDNLDTQIGF